MFLNSRSIKLTSSLCNGTYKIGWHQAHDQPREVLHQDFRMQFFGMVYTSSGSSQTGSREGHSNTEHGTMHPKIRKFLGMVYYLAPFMLNLACNTAPMRELLQDNVDYPWCPSHTRAFDIIECQISTETTLPTTTEANQLCYK